MGFLGALHAEVFRQRLEDEYQSEEIIRQPQAYVPVSNEVTISADLSAVVDRHGKETSIDNPEDFPHPGAIGRAAIAHVLEPTIRATIITPDEFTGPVMELCAVSD